MNLQGVLSREFMKITDVLGCAGWAGLFVLVLTWVPVVGPFFSLLTPLPFLYYSAKLGLSGGIKLTVYTIFILGLISQLTGQPQVTLFCLQFGLLGLALSEIYRRDLTLGYSLLLGCAVLLTAGLGILFVLGLSKNMGPREMLLGYLKENLDEVIEAYKGVGMEGERAAELEAFKEAFLETVSKIYPALMLIGTEFVVWLNVILSKVVFRARNLEFPAFVPMDRWRAPEHLVWIVIASGFSLFLSEGGLRWLAVNAVMVVMSVYLFQGFAILLFFLNKYRIPSWIRIGIYFLIILQQLFLGILSLAGLFDQWVDFRKIHRKRSR